MMNGGVDKTCKINWKLQVHLFSGKQSLKGANKFAVFNGKLFQDLNI